MSYCRFGDDSDVYLYASMQGGWVLHLPRSVYTRVSENIFDDRNWTPETRPHAGEVFSLNSREECLELLDEVKGWGYVVPEYAYNRIRKEMRFMGNVDKILEAGAEVGHSEEEVIEILDEMVHDAHSMEASETNNDGIHAQVRYLVDHFGYTIEDIIDRM